MRLRDHSVATAPAAASETAAASAIQIPTGITFSICLRTLGAGLRVGLVTVVRGLLAAAWWTLCEAAAPELIGTEVRSGESAACSAVCGLGAAPRRRLAPSTADKPVPETARLGLLREILCGLGLGLELELELERKLGVGAGAGDGDGVGIGIGVGVRGCGGAIVPTGDVVTAGEFVMVAVPGSETPCAASPGPTAVGAAAGVNVAMRGCGPTRHVLLQRIVFDPELAAVLLLEALGPVVVLPVVLIGVLGPVVVLPVVLIGVLGPVVVLPVVLIGVLGPVVVLPVVLIGVLGPVVVLPVVLIGVLGPVVVLPVVLIGVLGPVVLLPVVLIGVLGPVVLLPVVLIEMLGPVTLLPVLPLDDALLWLVALLALRVRPPTPPCGPPSRPE